MAEISHQTSGKTGTTQAYRDAWFVGYTGNYVAAVWFGNDDYSPTKRLTGGRLPAMTWNRFMTYAHNGIDLRPMPYLKKGDDEKQPAPRPIAKPNDAPPPVTVARQQPLPPETADLLRSLERELRNAKSLRPDKLVQSSTTGSAISVQSN